MRSHDRGRRSFDGSSLAPASSISCDLDVNRPSQKPNRERLRWSWLWLSGSALAMTAGFTASVGPNAATWFGVRGPHCPLNACLGPIACPGCGLVRGTCSALQGDLSSAFTYHPGGIIIALLLPATAALHLHILRRGRVLPTHLVLRRTGHLAFVSAIALGWLLRYLSRS